MRRIFDDPALQAHYDKLCTMFLLQDPELFLEDGGQNTHPPHSSTFWQGYARGICVLEWTSEEDGRLFSYASWRAGRDCRKVSDRHAEGPNETPREYFRGKPWGYLWWIL